MLILAYVLVPILTATITYCTLEYFFGSKRSKFKFKAGDRLVLKELKVSSYQSLNITSAYKTYYVFSCRAGKNLRLDKEHVELHYKLDS